MAIAKLSIDLEARLGNIEQGVSRAVRVFENGSSHIGAAFRGLIAPITAAVSATAAFNKIIESQRQFDVLNAGLQTATGNVKNAGEAFGVLQKFAAKTPYDLAQVTDSFTKLVNLGLTPSERALNSYGNTASAMGKDLNQMIEAVADAATGEFERLKEFGIKASAQGDKVAFTFRGVTTSVANNAASIEEYLTKIGENEFAGAMQKRMDSLDGALSNLGDSWDQLFRSISQAGVGKLIGDGVKVATDAIGELTAMVASGEVAAYIEGVAGKLSGIGEDVKRTLTIADDVTKEFFSSLRSEAGPAVDFVVGAFKNLPENVRAFVRIMTVEAASSFDQIKAYATAFKDGITAIFTSDTLDDVGKRLSASLDGINQVRQESLQGILAERDAAVASADVQIAKGKELRAQYDANQKADRAGTDALAQYKIDANGKLNAAQTKLMEEFRLAEQRRTLTATEFAIEEAKREAAAKLAQAGDNAELRRLVEEDLSRKIEGLKAREVDARARLEARLTGITQNEAEQRLDAERGSALGAARAWSNVAAMRSGSSSLNNGQSSWQQNADSFWTDFRSNFSADVPGFATGGSFVIGGNGGTDTTPVGFMGTRGERVTIETPEQQRAGRGGDVSIYITGAGMNAAQIIAAIKQALRTDPGLFDNGLVRAG